MADKPNILVIWGDDIGITNLSCYCHGLMGYRTPNIDRIASEGMLFTDSYGEQSCTAGRSSFITGQSVYRTGLSKVGIPGSTVGLPAEDADDRRVAQAARLRHRAVRQEPPGRPQRVPADRPRLRRVLRQPLPPQRRGGSRGARLPDAGQVPRASTRCFAPARRPAFLGHRRGRRHRGCRATGSVGKQRIEDTGPLTKKRMETVRRRVREAAASTSSSASTGRTHPFFAWVNSTHMHLRTHTKPESIGQAGPWQSPYHDTMIDHDRSSGPLLDMLDELGIADDTIVIYCTDNGPHMNTWPDGGDDPVPQREEHQLGGGLPRAGDDPLARQDRGRHRLQRDRPASRLAADVPRRRASPTSSRSSRPGHKSGIRRSRSTSTATTCYPT